MRASTRIGLAALLLSASACKSVGSRAESPEASLDDIAAIEAELSANEARLQAQGLVPPEHAGAPPRTRTPSAAPEPEPTLEPPPPQPTEPTEPTMAEAQVEEGEADEAAPMDRKRDVASNRKKNERDTREPTRCERICDLADSTCELADRICGLADEHVDDVRYQEACDRAEAQCELASDACSGCET